MPRSSWEPNPDDRSSIPTRCIKRIERDISDIVKNPPQGIFALPDEENMRLMTVLVTGPTGTPYHGGMFSFLVGFTDDYPLKPPKVRCLTTGDGSVRFNPNIYACGKVCLSILGTWNGPSWAAVMNLSSVVVSIQSLLNEEPYRNEPGRERASNEKIKTYSDVIQHETIRIAVIDVMEQKDTYHEYFVEKLETIFDENYDHYVEVCNKNIHLDGKTFNDPLDNKPCQFQYKELLKKLESLSSQRCQKRDCLDAPSSS